MSRSVRAALLATIGLIALALAWQLLTVIRSDAALDRGDPAAALALRPRNPEALARLAAMHLSKGDLGGAEAMARRILATSPADGRGYRLLAQVADARGQRARATRLYSIAVRRAPRDIEARAWLAQRALANGDYGTAMEHVDRVLSMSAWPAKARLFPVLVQLSADPAFADALANTLATHPSWRAKMLEALHDPTNPNPVAADHVLAGMQRRKDLDAAAAQAWVESLLRQGRWGEAFARWASPHLATGRPIPLLFNGDFSTEPEGAGFDWRIPSTPGVLASVEPGQGGGSLHLRFLGRRVSSAPAASHALMLPPGTYRLAWRQRLDALRAGTGLGWRVSCGDDLQALVQAEPDVGTRPWHDRELLFTVPASTCSGQWLRLASTGSTDAGQVVSGDVWYSDMKLTRESKK